MSACYSVAVLGAGLTGIATALELAHRGYAVALVDQDNRAVNRASLRNEGKIHLGLIYANEPGLATARLQLNGALRFRQLLSRWLGPRADSLSLSTPFIYVVAPDSLHSRDRLEEHYATVERLYHEHLRQHPSLDYLGQRPDRLYAACGTADLAPFLRAERFAGAFRTAELAVDPAQLARLLRRAIREEPRIRFMPNHTVKAVSRSNGGLRVEGNGPAGTWQLEAEQVVNALWENRLLIDRSIGVEPAPGWVHRLKYRVIAALPKSLHNGPSVTMVLGPYGDVVVRQDGTVYLSWYPLGLQGWTHEVAPPESWTRPCRGKVGARAAQSIASAVMAAIDQWYPGIAKSRPLTVDAGVIVGYGHTDVGDAASGLHGRSRIGVTSVAGYHSVDPGKLTTAPLFAVLTADHVTGTGATS